MAQTTTERGKNAEEQRTKADSREPLGRVIEIVGSSEKSFDDAITTAVERAHETIRHITGIEVRNMSAKVDGSNIVEYRVDLKLAFGVEPPEMRE